MRKNFFLKKNKKDLYISIKVMLRNIVLKKNINISLLMCLIIFYMIKKFDFAFK